jgi:hypothetical protein
MPLGSEFVDAIGPWLGGVVAKHLKRACRRSANGASSDSGVPSASVGTIVRGSARGNCVRDHTVRVVKDR